MSNDSVLISNVKLLTLITTSDVYIYIYNCLELSVQYTFIYIFVCTNTKKTVINLNCFRKIDSDERKEKKEQNKGVYDLLQRYTSICFHRTVQNNNNSHNNNNKDKKSFCVFKSMK